jgi:tetratricopeptide (TPR) repeat protein
MDLSEALHHFLESIRIKPNEPYYYQRAAEVAMAMMDFPSAIKFLEKTIELNPSSLAAHLNIAGNAFLNNKNFEKY